MPRIACCHPTVLLFLLLCLLNTPKSCQSFQPILMFIRVTPPSPSITSTILSAKARKAQKSRKVERSRPQQFYDAINDAQDKETKKKSSTAVVADDAEQQQASSSSSAANKEMPSLSKEDMDREARAEAARARMDARPEVSTMIVDEETGIEIVAQGKSVMDVITRKPVQLSNLGPEYRLAEMFPGVPPNVREKYRMEWTGSVEIPEVVEKLLQASQVTLSDGSKAIPPHPSISNNAIDFVLANRDWMGQRMTKTLGRLMLRNMSLGNKEQAKEYRSLLKNYMTVENHISSPFRQTIMDAEGRMGPNFGNLDLMSYANGELYERVANYLVLKGMVAHWEKKVVDADYQEKTPQTKENYITVLSHGDPRRYLPDPPILFTLRECSQVCLMSQNLTNTFVSTPALFADFPPEVRFLEAALSIKGGTRLRQFMIQEFCPGEGLTPEALREGMRRLHAQLENMQIDPYADITNLLERLCRAMAIGTDDERSPYIEYLAPNKNGPGSFQTYTFDYERQSLVRFLDAQYDGATAGGGDSSSNDLQQSLPSFFDFGVDTTNRPEQPETTQKAYKVPPARSVGRPHELGWLDMFNEEKKDENARLGRVAPGKIIVEQDE